MTERKGVKDREKGRRKDNEIDRNRDRDGMKGSNRDRLRDEVQNSAGGTDEERERM